MPLSLSDPALLKSEAFVAGAWRGADDGAVYPVTNPADGGEIATVPDMGTAEARAAIEAANAAWPQWRATIAKERGRILRQWFELMMAAQDDLGRLMTAEQGKPLAEAKGEVAYGASFIEWFAEEGRRTYGETIPAHGPDKRIVVTKEPVGVCAAITPWNFPIAMITRKVAPALAAGCPIVVKPAEDTPLSALAMAELAQRAGLPDGLFSVITASRDRAADVGAELTGNPLVRKFSFTGSTATGKILMRQCADTVKRISLELGGNAPFIVFDDADLDKAVAGLMASKYRNTGQTCVCANRIFVQSGIYDAFAGRLKEKVSALTVGPGLDGETQQGPLINQKALEKVERHVSDALEKGAHIHLGGQRHALGGTFYEPTILTGATTDMALTHEETFGPVAPLYRFETEEEAVAMANDTPFGLAAYFFSSDAHRVWRVAEALEAGMVGINEGMMSTEIAPFGGVKESGIGREGAKDGIEEYLETKYMCFGGF